MVNTYYDVASLLEAGHICSHGIVKMHLVRKRGEQTKVVTLIVCALSYKCQRLVRLLIRHFL